MLCMLVVGECLFERRTRQPIADAARKLAQIQPLACRIDGPQQPLQSPLQILRANQKGLGFFFAGFDEANRRQRWQGREEVFFRPRCIEFESAIEFQHTVRILRGG